MSLTTWTPTELAFNRQTLDVVIWRAVEAQHLTSTLALVDSLSDQAEIEQLLENSKPLIPAAARHLHYLLATPFRYPPLPRGSRFRAAIDSGRIRIDSCVNLLEPPLVAERSAWNDPSDYTHCQRFARTAREAPIEAIRYESVHDPEHGPCVAVLSPSAFAVSEPLEQQGWQLIVNERRVWWIREVIGSATRLEFDTSLPH